jgi:protein-tyrosine phosphatase
MAEALLRVRMPESWRGKVEVSSAGTMARDGQQAALTALDVMEDLGIDLCSHRARRLTEEIVSRADLIVAMAEEHAEAVLALDQEAGARLLKLGELDPEREEIDIADPIGGDSTIYAASRDEIDQLVTRLIWYISNNFNI